MFVRYVQNTVNTQLGPQKVLRYPIQTFLYLDDNNKAVPEHKLPFVILIYLTMFLCL